jgi:hypothetical protein
MGRNVVRKEQGAPTKRDDVYSWLCVKLSLLGAGRLSEIDPVAIAEEIDDVGEEEYHGLESALRVMMLNLLEWVISATSAAVQGLFRSTNIGGGSSGSFGEVRA